MACHGWIREVLLADRDAPRKQRHTAKRIRDRLAEEQGVLISESQCRAVVARIRAEIAAEVGTPAKAFVPQTRLPGAEGEVDWGKFDAVIGGQTLTLHLFSMWLAYSTAAFHRAYVNEAQESFADAHVRAFGRLYGRRRGRYARDRHAPPAGGPRTRETPCDDCDPRPRRSLCC